MKTSIIIPCYNEKNTIIELVNRVIALPIEKEIIIVDDGSTDGSAEIIDKELSNKVDKIIHKNNGGKGSALRAGFAAATGDIVIPQDADLELDCNDIIKVIEPIVAGKTDAASGSRFLHQKMKGGGAHRLANFVLTKYASIMFKQKITDVNTCYIAFKRDLLSKLDLKENKFAFNEEIFGKLSKLGIKIIETQINYIPRKKSEGKKLQYKDGFDALKAIWKYRYRKGK